MTPLTMSASESTNSDVNNTRGPPERSHDYRAACLSTHHWSKASFIWHLAFAIQFPLCLQPELLIPS
jgi:hypothetical protein